MVFDSRNDILEDFNSSDGGESCDGSEIMYPRDYVTNSIDMPPVPPDTKEVDSLLAKGMNELSMEEREKLFDDLHGVGGPLTAKPDEEEEQLQQLEKELENIKQKEAYFIAKSISPIFVNDRNFRRKFLIASNFDPKHAAERIVRHFEVKMEIYGKQKLTKDILLSDLPEEDVAKFRNGYLQILPFPDRTGRLVFCCIGSAAAGVSLETRCRMLFYFLMAISENEETIKRGAVLIYYGIGQRTTFRDKAQKIVALFQSMPLRVSALHVCYDNPILYPLIKLASLIMHSSVLTRCRFHYGSQMEVIHELGSFGIAKTSMKMLWDENGNVNKGSAAKWLEERFKAEAVKSKEFQALVPGQTDVLLGRGKRVHESSGNKIFRNILENYRPRYEAGTNFEKTVVSEAILRLIKDSGGRFLKQGDSGWAEIDDLDARKKISHAFRNLRSTPATIARRAKTAGGGVRAISPP